MRIKNWLKKNKIVYAIEEVPDSWFEEVTDFKPVHSIPTTKKKGK
jgi:hypothetical protein